MLLYGRDMPRVKQMIEQYKNKFEHEPRGPLGKLSLHFKVWSDINAFLFIPYK